jgi:hypothetical protein
MEFLRQQWVVFLKKSYSHIPIHYAIKASYSPFGIPQGPLVLELSKKSRSYFLAGGYVRATWARVKSHDARKTRTSVRKPCAISRTRHYVMNTCDGWYFTHRLQGNKKHCSDYIRFFTSVMQEFCWKNCSSSGILIMGVRLTFYWTAAAFTGLLFVPGWEWMNG